MAVDFDRLVLAVRESSDYLLSANGAVALAHKELTARRQEADRARERCAEAWEALNEAVLSRERRDALL